MSPIFTVYRIGERSPRVQKTELLEDGEHVLLHNHTKVPIKVENDTVTVHADKAEGKIGNCHLNGFDDDLTLSSRGDATDISFRLRPESQKANSALVIHGDYESGEQDLYVERHDRKSRNFPANKERE